MKIKLGLTILLTIASFHYGYCQDTEEKQKTYSNSIGVDAVFINNFLPFETEVGTEDSYLIHFIKYGRNDGFIRQAFDFDISGVFKKSDALIDNNTVGYGLDYKISLGKRKNLFKKGYLLYGGEARLGYNRSQRTNLDPSDPDEESINANTLRNTFFAVGPFAGFEYKLTNRISLYTEGGFYLSVLQSSDAFTSELVPDLNEKDTSFSFNTLKSYPRTLILFYSF